LLIRCFAQGDAQFTPQNINPYLCTHLIYAFGGLGADDTLVPFDEYQDIEKGGYGRFAALKTYNKDLKTMLAIGGWNEGSRRFSPMVEDPARRQVFIKSALRFLRQYNFDGVDLDWEYPTLR
jgi:chitinase